MRILITGGCGFIGSNFIKYLLKDINRRDIEILNLDKLTYASKGRNLEHMKIHKDKRYKFIKGDIRNKNLLKKIFLEETPEIIFNFAAESHTDKSIKQPEDFLKTNILGVHNILEFVRKYNVKKFIQISTDEVYGSIMKGSFT